ncbi:unnamed protein product [Callosobruchus maculatus]|uniref:Uncharacterized protein n=1 Tax=Callosobruchus maculatus TaxID=64391 RepID=A0A653DDF7_CALMS|nr:unnamed protein product [Callosobruchus maculatus]
MFVVESVKDNKVIFFMLYNPMEVCLYKCNYLSVHFIVWPKGNFVLYCCIKLMFLRDYYMLLYFNFYGNLQK